MNNNTHLSNRDWIVSALAGEIFGPGGRFKEFKNDLYAPAVELEPRTGQIFEGWDEYNARYVHAGDREEILKEEAPSRRYGVGLLFPDDEKEFDSEADLAGMIEANGSGKVGYDEEGDREEGPQYERKLRSEKQALGERLMALRSEEEDRVTDDETDIAGVGLCRIRKPRSMGVSFVADLTAKGDLAVELEGARYRPIKGISIRWQDDGKTKTSGDKTWWIRVPVAAKSVIPFDQLLAEKSISVPLSLDPGQVVGLPILDLELVVISRPHTSPLVGGGADLRLLTVSVVNRTKKGTEAIDDTTLFQARFTASASPEELKQFVIPYPEVSGRKMSEEEESLALLYSSTNVFATGHGCAGDWCAEEGADRARCVIAEPLPVYKTPPVTPDLIHPETKKPLRIFMAPLMKDGPDLLPPLEELAGLYEKWIEERLDEAGTLEDRFREAAVRHLDNCRLCAERIRDGLALLQEDPLARKAFCLTNQAILTQQVAGGLGKRIRAYNAKNHRLEWDKVYSFPDPGSSEGSKRAWRPFQIAFLLMSLRGVWDGHSPDREVADLIWFPTGGGKTEAYLGAASFSMFSRRLKDPEDDGTDVLMRYTLRLLTSQQFQRASGLICAMEQIRQTMPDRLGNTPYRIGIWVGGSTTPNWHTQSVKRLSAANRVGEEEYAHAIMRCPWCGAAIGPRKRLQNEPGQSRYICDGLRATGRGDARKVVLHCPDPQCLFKDELPVRVVDEGIYNDRPSLVIGTVDKFAMLAWRPEARSIFGRDASGAQKTSPPSLIIQDELHLITGPLGSMVGLYEGLIEELCTDRRAVAPVLPKLIASTATTRASARQIRELYAREETMVFPAPGLDVGDSFFAKYDRFEDNVIKPGRMYMGVMAPSYGSSLTTNVRVFSTLLAAAFRIKDPKERDPWWTLLVFYNSLRELGADLTLFGADIPERLGDLKKRWSPSENRRFLREVKELTGRLSNSEVPQALDMLERSVGEHTAPVDACLASNIIEVGVDVGRLGVMAVSGQPKTMAQYIQATGRVGRERDKPGLIVTVYASRKARDLSHFEHFIGGHSRLYSQVEPASITSFTLPVLERALHGVMVAWIRQHLDENLIRRPRPGPSDQNIVGAELRRCREYLLKRVRLLFKTDPASLAHTEELLDHIYKQRLGEWRLELPDVWKAENLTADTAEKPLMKYYGEPCPPKWVGRCWEVPTSMRGVDAECPACIHQPIRTNPDELTADNTVEFL
jgi:hypothetical protein